MRILDADGREVHTRSKEGTRYLEPGREFSAATPGLALDHECAFFSGEPSGDREKRCSVGPEDAAQVKQLRAAGRSVPAAARLECGLRYIGAAEARNIEPAPNVDSRQYDDGRKCGPQCP